jgi:hypothetical protein
MGTKTASKTDSKTYSKEQAIAYLRELDQAIAAYDKSQKTPAK